MLTRRAYPEIGGVEKHIHQVGKILKRKGHEVGVISAKDIKYPKVRFLGILFIWFWMLKNFKRFRGADIVHAHDVAIWYLPLRLLFPKKPFYVTFHGWEGKFPIPARYKFIRKISEKMARENICVGEYIVKWYGIRPTYVIYGGIKNELKSNNGKIKTINENLKILFLGRLQEDTGIFNILKVCDLLKNKHLNMEMRFLGDGPLKDKAQKYGRVLGFQKDTAPYLTGSRFVFTSGYLSMLEAMVAGKLVFAMYDNPLKRDTLRMSPFSRHAIVMNDPQELAQKIDYFLKNPKKERDVIANAYNWAHRQTWDKVADTYLKLWEKT